jgi:hypothetical protein
LKVRKQPLDGSSLDKTNIYHRKITCRYVLDIGPSTAESTVECNSTLDLVQQKAQSSVTRHWIWYSRKYGRVSLDIRPGTAESTVKCNATLDGQGLITFCGKSSESLRLKCVVRIVTVILYTRMNVRCCDLHLMAVEWRQPDNPGICEHLAALQGNYRAGEMQIHSQ